MKKSATIKDVAARAGVAIGTVSNYINATKPVASGTAQKIEDAIAELRFVPNNAVRTLHGRSSRVIGFVVPDATNPFFSELSRTIEDEARARDCLLVFCDTEGNAVQEREYLRRLAEMRVTGVILASIHHDTVRIDDLESVGANVVLLGDEGSVKVDDERGGYLAMNHLLSIGRKNILFAGGPGAGTILDERMEGAQRALQEFPDTVRLQRVDAVGRLVSERAALVDSILGGVDRPDAVFCGNDMIAITLMNALLRRGVRIPDDVAIVGYDDVEAASQAIIPLTTVRQPIQELGQIASELLFRPRSATDSHRQRITLEPELVVRESTVRTPNSVTISF